MESNPSLPSDDATLANVFTATEYAQVAHDDSSYAEQCATNDYWIFLFKNQNSNNTDSIEAHWNGQTGYAPSVSPVILEIYNRVSGAWEELDREDTAPADIDLDLWGSVLSDASDYYDANYWISCRVYQEIRL